MIVREAARILENSLTFTMRISREYEDKFGIDGAKIGTVLNIRLPVRYTDTVGQGLQLQDVTETSVPLVLTTQYQRSFVFSSADLALSIDDYKDRFLKPALASMANQIDFDGLLLYRQIYNEIGTPGTVPNALLTYLQAGQRLDEEAAPRDDERCLVLNPAMHATIVDALKGLFNPQVTIGEQYKKGMIGKATLGFDWYMDQNIRTHVIGILGGVPLVNGAGQTGASLITNGWTAAAATRLQVGDVFTVASVFAVNPQNRQSTGALRQFVCTAPGASDGAGNMTISIYPSIVTSGPYQTTDVSPANAAALTILGAASTNTPQGLAFHKDAFMFATADLQLPGGVDMAARMADKQLGMSIRAVRAYDINTDRFPLRLDLLGGWGVKYPQLACRIAS